MKRGTKTSNRGFVSLNENRKFECKSDYVRNSWHLYAQMRVKIYNLKYSTKAKVKRTEKKHSI